MEIEMKAPLNADQLEALLTKEKIKNYTFSSQRELLIKSDIYYSFGGERLKKPKNIVRIREESTFDSIKIDQAKAFVLEVNGRNITTDAINLFTFACKYFFDFRVNPLTSNSNSFLTIKRKHTDEFGVETNDEKESKVSDKESLFALLGIVNFKPYFEKIKRSISFYAGEMHLEIVSVNASDVYLEIEICIPEKDTSSATVEAAQKTIKDFFKDALGITTFDSRSWAEISNT